MYAIAFRDLVPQVFELNRPLRIAFGQQGRRNFSTNYNPTMFSLYTLGCSHNEIAYHLLTANGIERIVDCQS